jgi:peptide/nickel transport system permease protein
MFVASLIASASLPDPESQSLAGSLEGPGSPGHLLGSDQLGRDVLAWTAAGIRTSLFASCGVVLISAVVGTAIGLLSGYLGGWRDTVLMRIVDLQLAVPPLLIFIAVASSIRPTIFTIILLLSVVGWVPYARIVRSRTLAERERPFIAAARLSGTGVMRIVTRALVPAVMPLVVVYASLQAGYVLLWEAALSFLGFGVQPPRESLGYMIAQGKDLLATSWWITAIPGLGVVFLALAFNLIGDGLRDMFHLKDSDEVIR